MSDISVADIGGGISLGSLKPEHYLTGLQDKRKHSLQEGMNKTKHLIFDGG